MLQVFFQVGSPRPPHEETHLNISQLGMDIIWAKCCEMKVELKLQRATLQEKRTRSRVLLCTGTTCSQCHAPSYTSVPIGSFMPCPSWMGEDAGEEMV